jgi:hypothetical protein
VYEGNTINFIANRTDRVVHGFDSFQGLPEAWRLGFDKAAFKVSDYTVLQFAANVEIHKGLFAETLPEFVSDHSAESISFLHVDCDLYTSTKTIFDGISNLLVSGSIIVFDEYFNYPGWREQEFKAFEEYVTSRGIEYEYIAFNKLGEQVAVMIR